jgi:hypothetical protein
MPYGVKSSKTFIRSFWKRVDIRSDEECWNWIGSKTSQGYGRIFISYKRCWAHRISFELTYGPIPEGKVILHQCDNPSCVNPSHLSIGTQGENIADMDKKGRRNPPKAEKHGRAKLTWGQVREIRRRYVRGQVRQLDLALEFGVNQGTIGNIVRGEGWITDSLDSEKNYA